MKKILVLLIVICSLTPNSYATHVTGGAITWECLGTGDYIFKMMITRDCSGIPWTFRNETIQVIGAPGPGLGTISLSPDMVLWQNQNNGTSINEICDDATLSFSCQNGDVGTIQQFFYKSAPITLTGIPPAQGWQFVWQAPCCRTLNNNVTNIITNAGSEMMLIRSRMFPTANRDSVNPCIDSSPAFIEYPQVFHYKQSHNSYTLSGFDNDLDSLDFEWTRAYDAPVTNPFPLPYKPGYAFNLPLPGPSVDVRNEIASLNPLTGQVNFTTYSGIGLNRYVMVNSVSSYRQGIKIAEVNLEYQLFLTDPDTLASGDTNQAPMVNIPLVQDSNGVYIATVLAGNTLSFPISINDNDSTGVGNNKQSVKLYPSGLMFSNDFSDSVNCKTNVDSCATLHPAPNLNSTAAAGYSFNDSTGLINTTFNWITSCELLRSNNTAKTYYFNLKYRDDHCPIPAQSNRVIAITVMPSAACGTVTANEKVSGFNQNLQLFPNPNTGVFNLNVTGDYGRLTIEIRNIAGQLVNKQQFNSASSMELNINGEAGIYFVQVQNENGERANLKVVKQ